jgi:hypothetical protein
MGQAPNGTALDERARTTGRKSAPIGRIEVITRGERRRVWTPAQKREIVAESLAPGLTAAEVARKHGISTGLLYTWRQRLLAGPCMGPFLSRVFPLGGVRPGRAHRVRVRLPADGPLAWSVLRDVTE